MNFPRRATPVFSISRSDVLRFFIVTDVVNRDRRALDELRKTTANSLYWLFAALIVGAFCSSFAATLGGKQRDRDMDAVPRAAGRI